MIRRNKIAAADQPLIQLRQVSKRFAMHHEQQRSFQETFIRFFQRKRDRGRQFWALNDVTLEVRAGDCFGIVGSNGSGKSTLLSLITGIVEPTSGDIITNGRIASLLELGAGFHPELTGRENIFLNGSVYGLSRRQMLKKLDEIIDFTELGDFIDVPIKHYSSGMYVRLGFAVAVHTEPDVLLVDEVLAVGDASFQHKCLDRIQKFRTRGGTLVLVSHDMGTIQSLCNQTVWLDGGQVRAAGQPADVVMAYLNEVAQREENQATVEPAPKPSKGQNRWGTGKISITRVELCDGTGAPRYIFVTGGVMEVRLHYRVEGRVEEPVFGIAIHHQNGAHLCGPNTDFGGLRIASLQGEGQVVFRIPALPLLEGAYDISASVVDRGDSETYDYHDRAYPFRVSPGASRERYGMVTLSGEWQITTDVVATQV
jgi:lipopolysaccharide transport system ATP-binding protein